MSFPPIQCARTSRAPLVPAGETEAVDRQTVVFTTHRPSAYLIDFLTETRFQIIPAHISDLEQLAANPVGTGPWMHESTTVDVETVLVKNSDYFRTDPEGRALPFLDGLTWMQFADFDPWLAALKTGQTRWSTTSKGTTCACRGP